MATQNVKVVGEAAVNSIASEINKKLTKVTSMPESPALNMIVLYVGTTTGAYTQGNLYQWDGTQWNQLNQGGAETADCYKTSDSVETNIADGDYFPFYDTSASAKRKSLWSNIKAKLNEIFFTRSENNILGAKNLNSYPYESSPFPSTPSLTWTDNGDGTITTSAGTTSGTNIFDMHKPKTSSDATSLLRLPNGRYKLTGCPEGGSSNAYFLQTTIRKNSTYIYSYDYGDGVEIEVDGDDYDQNSAYIGLMAVIKSGVTVPQMTWMPMIRLASDPDNTWQKGTMTNRELTNKVMNPTIPVDPMNEPTAEGSIWITTT